MNTLRFDVTARDGRARAATLAVRRVELETPCFMPVATHAAIRCVNFEHVRALGVKMLLANSLHLLLRPGLEMFDRFGGIHGFMRWDHGVLTDSGGFQLFSMPAFRRLGGDGAEFRSYVDGAKILLTPELSIGAQQRIGSDIMMAFDLCVSSKAEFAETAEAVEVTARWAERSIAARTSGSQALFGIVQGGCSPELRARSASQITALPFDGYALGGLAVGESLEERRDVVSAAAELLPENRPRYLMGVGTPLDLLDAVARGMDMFDCIIPTAHGQQGVAYTSRGKIDLKRGVYRSAEQALDPACSCPACVRYSRAYLRHLVGAGERFGEELIAVHNLHHYDALMKRARRNIIAGDFERWYRSEAEIAASVDLDNPSVPPPGPARKETGQPA